MKSKQCASLLVFVLFAGAPSWSQERPRGASAAIPAEHRYHVSDDLATWAAMEVLIPAGSDAEGWVEAAGGSTPWEDRTELLWIRGRRPGPRGELVGYSRLEGDEDEAVHGAEESAIRQIAALVIWSVRDRLSRLGLVRFDELARLAEAEARRALDRTRVDSFVQVVERPYGTLYRCAVLLRVDEKSLRGMAQKLNDRLARAETRARAERRVLLWKGGIAAALAVIVMIGYLALNALTQGFFTWRLRLLSLLGLGAAYTILALIRV